MPVVKIGDDLVDVTGATPEQLRALKAAYAGKAEPKYTGGQAFLAGATELLGGGDEIAGALGVPASYLTGKMKGMGLMERFEAGRKKYRGVLDKAQQDHPAAFLSGALVGTGGVTGAATKGLFKGVQSIGQLMSRGAAVGTGEGAIAGALSGEPGERTESAIRGATLGGAAGAVLPAALRGAGNTGRYLRDKTVKFGSPERVSEHASRKLDALLEARGDTIKTAAARMDDSPARVLADHSDMTRGQLAALISKPGSTADAAREQLNERIAQQFPRFNEFFTQALGGVPLTQARQAIQAATKTQADPLYQAVKQMDFDDEAAKAVGKLYARNPGAVKKVKGLMMTAGEATAKKDINTLTPRFANDYQHFLNDEAQRLLRSGKKKQARALIGLRRDVLEVMDELPGYAQARSTYKQGFANEDALEAGNKLFTSTSDDIDAVVKNFDSDTETEMFKVGAFNAIMERLGKTNDLTDATRIFRTPAVHKKLRKVLSEDEYKEFLKRIEEERVMAQTATSVHSKPGAETAQDSVFNPRQTNIPGGFGYLAGGGGGSGARVGAGVVSAGILDKVMSAGAGPFYGAGNRARDDYLGKMLLQSNPEAMMRMYKPSASPDYTTSGLMGTIPSALYPMLPGN